MSQHVIRKIAALSVRRLGALAALTLLGVTTANATLVTATTAGGSEAILSIVDGTGASISVDLGENIGAIAPGDTYSLTTAVTNFINTAGGLSAVQFAVIGGGAANGTSAGQYLQSSDNTSVSSLSNAIKGTWLTKLADLVTKLNAIDATAGNLTYGPIASGVNGNYVTTPSSNGYDDWGSAGTCAQNDNICNLVAGDKSAFLYLINFAASVSGFATIDGIGGIVAGAPAGTGSVAYLDTANSRLVISAVPAPATVWLLLTGIGGLFVKARRRLAASC